MSIGDAVKNLIGIDDEADEEKISKDEVKEAKAPAQVEGSRGFQPQPEKDLERPSSTRLEARFPTMAREQ